MFYSRYFSGTIETDTSARESIGEYAVQQTVYPERSKIHANAIVDTLKDVGFNAEYRESERAIYPDKAKQFHFYLFYSGAQTLNFWVLSGATRVLYAVSTTSTPLGQQPFGTNGDYKFRVSVMGEPNKMIYLATGNASYADNYISTAAYTQGFMLGKATGTVDGGAFDIISQWTTSNPFSPSAYYAITDDMEGHESVTLSAAIKGTENNLALIDLYTTNGLYKFDNCYLGNSILTSGVNSFYNINGVEYYMPNTTMIVKCPTQYAR